ncbi:dipeptidase PepE [Psychroflexus sp. ALD_RP9]|uniref:dipeptidase PepE n=1 Tax=Psychroflexus sp. ALD_RP9 TaxID=2777186 RepID=UPI001A8F2295|nr:dipeptidase PepE [Psychroflexus sp. ALD_RP9]QSS97560.1 dipeptidase PepE [Psychroflexus sp. ALD_RP9]
MNCIIASTSTIHGSNYLEYLKPKLIDFFKYKSKLVFIPFARPSGISHDEYTLRVKESLGDVFNEIKGLHEFKHPIEAITQAEAIFTGGGNTFLLTKELHEQGLIEPLTMAIQKGTNYLGTSAGSNICGPNMKTTNDMPIVYPPSFKTLGILNFNINAHYLDPNPNSTHKGETRETRLKEFLTQNNQSVVGLREGSYLEIEGRKITLKGKLTARIFEADKTPYELESGQTLNYL